MTYEIKERKVNENAPAEARQERFEKGTHMRTFIIDTPLSASGRSMPFTIAAHDMEEALDRITAHMGSIWQRGEYSFREVGSQPT